MRTGRYTPEEDSFLVRHYGQSMSITEISAALDRSESSVGNRAYKLRSARALSITPGTRHNGWTEEQDTTLEREWGLTDDFVLAERLGRTVVALQLRAYYIGCSKRENRTYYA